VPRGLGKRMRLPAQHRVATAKMTWTARLSGGFEVSHRCCSPHHTIAQLSQNIDQSRKCRCQGLCAVLFHWRTLP
jgi:hypothetical protein